MGDKAGKILYCAGTYLEHADRLMYSFGSKTFLSGYDLYDEEHEGRGNIDCSTFVMLVLCGIPYEESPYVKGPGSVRRLHPAEWAEQDLIDFSGLPERFVDIAEQIGRPYLKGPKGLDLKKAEDLGIGMDVLAAELKAAGVSRRTHYLSQYYMEKGACFSDPASARPADLVFFKSGEFFTEDDRTYPVVPQISHVGIISEDTSMMIHSSGSWKRSLAGGHIPPAVRLSKVTDGREPAFFARP